MSELALCLHASRSKKPHDKVLATTLLIACLRRFSLVELSKIAYDGARILISTQEIEPKVRLWVFCDPIQLYTDSVSELFTERLIADLRLHPQALINFKVGPHSLSKHPS